FTTACLFQGVRKNGQANRVQLAAWQQAFLVGRLGEAEDRGSGPVRFDGHPAERVSENVTEQDRKSACHIPSSGRTRIPGHGRTRLPAPGGKFRIEVAVPAAVYGTVEGIPRLALVPLVVGEAAASLRVELVAGLTVGIAVQPAVGVLLGGAQGCLAQRVA